MQLSGDSSPSSTPAMISSCQGETSSSIAPPHETVQSMQISVADHYKSVRPAASLRRINSRWMVVVYSV